MGYRGSGKSQISFMKSPSQTETLKIGIGRYLAGFRITGSSVLSIPQHVMRHRFTCVPGIR